MQLPAGRPAEAQGRTDAQVAAHHHHPHGPLAGGSSPQCLHQLCHLRSEYLPACIGAMYSVGDLSKRRPAAESAAARLHQPAPCIQGTDQAARTPACTPGLVCHTAGGCHSVLQLGHLFHQLVVGRLQQGSWVLAGDCLCKTAVRHARLPAPQPNQTAALHSTATPCLCGPSQCVPPAVRGSAPPPLRLPPAPAQLPQVLPAPSPWP